jgi:hypothetical protein
MLSIPANTVKQKQQALPIAIFSGLGTSFEELFPSFFLMKRLHTG